MTGSFIHPALIMIAGALLLPFIRGPFRKPYLCLVPILAFCETTEPGKPKQFWIATRGAGLAKEVGKGWQIITTADGLCNIHVTALLETRDPSGHWLWAGTYNGLSRLRLERRGAGQHGAIRRIEPPRLAQMLGP